MSKILVDRGQNVLLVPNPWGADWLVSQPVQAPGKIIEEAEAIKKGVRLFVEGEATKFEKLNLVGISYGGFLSAIIYGSERDSDLPLVDGDVTLFSPPRNIYQSLLRLDREMDRYPDLYLADPKAGMFSIFTLATVRSDEDLNESLIQKVTGFSVWIGFQYGLVSVAEAVIPPKLLGAPEDHESEEYKMWRKGFRFEEYAKRFIATDGAFSQEELKRQQIDYWIRSEDRETPVRILTTQDDFINDSEEAWDIPGVDTVVLDKGSHYGYRSIPWFKMFMDFALK